MMDRVVRVGGKIGPISEIAESLQVTRVTESAVSHVPKKRKCTGELSTTKWPGRQQKATKVDNHNI